MNPARFDEDTFLRFFRTLDERQARLCAAERALALGRGGITRLAGVTGLSQPTIRKGVAELRSGAPTLPAGRIRRAGGGRKKVEVVHAAVLLILQEVVDASTAGSPTDVLRWTSKSKTNLAVALAGRGHRMAPNTVGRLLRELGYSLQANRKDKEGRSPPERAVQVGYLNDQARTFLERGQPVISVDTKKKELVGDFKNAGREWHPEGPGRRELGEAVEAQSAVAAAVDGEWAVQSGRLLVDRREIAQRHDDRDEHQWIGADHIGRDQTGQGLGDFEQEVVGDHQARPASARPSRPAARCTGGSAPIFRYSPGTGTA